MMSLSPNHSSRQGNKIEYVVLHSTAGGYAGSVAWLCNPASNASVHYVIGRDGKIACLVDEARAAWHVRQEVGNWNLTSIGIELVDDRMTENWMTEVQYDKLVTLCSQIVQRYQIPLDSGHFLMHKTLDPKRRHDPVGWTLNTLDQFVTDVFNKLHPVNPLPPEVLDMDAKEYRNVQTHLEYIKAFKFAKGLWLKNDNGTFKEINAKGEVVQSFGTPEQLTQAGWRFGDEN